MAQPQPQVLFAGTFNGGASSSDEITFSSAVVVTQIQVCPGDGSRANSLMLPDFTGSTRPPGSPFSMQLHCLDLCKPDKGYLDALLPMQQVGAGGVYQACAEVITCLIVISGRGYEQLSLVLYGHVLLSESLPAVARTALAAPPRPLVDGAVAPNSAHMEVNTGGGANAIATGDEEAAAASSYPTPFLFFDADPPQSDAAPPRAWQNRLAMLRRPPKRPRSSNDAQASSTQASSEPFSLAWASSTLLQNVAERCPWRSDFALSEKSREQLDVALRALKECVVFHRDMQIALQETQSALEECLAPRAHWTEGWSFGSSRCKEEADQLQPSGRSSSSGSTLGSAFNEESAEVVVTAIRQSFHWFWSPDNTAHAASQSEAAKAALRLSSWAMLSPVVAGQAAALGLVDDFCRLLALPDLPNHLMSFVVQSLHRGLIQKPFRSRFMAADPSEKKVVGDAGGEATIDSGYVAVVKLMSRCGLSDALKTECADLLQLLGLIEALKWAHSCAMEAGVAAMAEAPPLTEKRSPLAAIASAVLGQTPEESSTLDDLKTWKERDATLMEAHPLAELSRSLDALTQVIGDGAGSCAHLGVQLQGGLRSCPGEGAAEEEWNLGCSSPAEDLVDRFASSHQACCPPLLLELAAEHHLTAVLATAAAAVSRAALAQVRCGGKREAGNLSRAAADLYMSLRSLVLTLLGSAAEADRAAGSLLFATDPGATRTLVRALGGHGETSLPKQCVTPDAMIDGLQPTLATPAALARLVHASASAIAVIDCAHSSSSGSSGKDEDESEPNVRCARQLYELSWGSEAGREAAVTAAAAFGFLPTALLLGSKSKEPIAAMGLALQVTDGRTRCGRVLGRSWKSIGGLLTGSQRLWSEMALAGVGELAASAADLLQAWSSIDNLEHGGGQSGTSAAGLIGAISRSTEGLHSLHAYELQRHSTEPRRRADSAPLLLSISLAAQLALEGAEVSCSFACTLINSAGIKTVERALRVITLIIARQCNVALAMQLISTAKDEQDFLRRLGGVLPGSAEALEMDDMKDVKQQSEDIKRGLATMRHLRLALTASLPPLRLMQFLLQHMKSAGCLPPLVKEFHRKENEEGTFWDPVGSVLDLQAAVASFLPWNGSGDGEVTVTNSVALRVLSLAAGICSLWRAESPCTVNEEGDGGDEGGEDGGSGSDEASQEEKPGNILQRISEHCLGSPSHHIGGVSLLVELMLPSQCCMPLQSLPLAALSGGCTREVLRRIHLSGGLDSSEGLRRVWCEQLEVRLQKLLFTWDEEACQGIYQQRVGSGIPFESNPLMSVTGPGFTNVPAVVACLCHTSSPILASLVRSLACRAVDLGPGTAQAVAGSLVSSLISCVERHLTFSGAGTDAGAGKDDRMWQSVLRILLVVHDLARLRSPAGRVALLSQGVLDALLPCLGITKPQVIRATLPILMCFCDGQARTGEVRRFSRPQCRFSTVATAVRNVVAKYHRVDLAIHAGGARLLASLGSSPLCAGAVMVALRPKGPEASGASVPEGKSTMVLPRLYSGLVKGLEDTTHKYRVRATMEATGPDASKAAELDAKVLALLHAACWVVQLPQVLMSEGLMEASEVLPLLVPASVAPGAEPIVLLHGAVETFMTLFVEVAPVLVQRQAVNPLNLIACRQYLRILYRGTTRILQAAEALRASGGLGKPSGWKDSEADTPSGTAERPQPWFFLRTLTCASCPERQRPSLREVIEVPRNLWWEQGECLGLTHLSELWKEDSEAAALLVEERAPCWEVAAIESELTEKKAASLVAARETLSVARAQSDVNLPTAEQLRRMKRVEGEHSLPASSSSANTAPASVSASKTKAPRKDPRRDPRLRK
jgi:hypothetical protein